MLKIYAKTANMRNEKKHKRFRTLAKTGKSERKRTLRTDFSLNVFRRI